MPEPVVLAAYDPSWPAQYEAEKARLMGALGYCTEGGAIYHIEHIGSTSIPGMVAKPCIDILIDAYPFPLPEESVQAMRDLGYEYRGDNGIPGREYFTLGPHRFHVHSVSVEGSLWPDHILFRDYLRVNAEKARQYADLKLELAGKYRDNRTSYTDGKADLVERLKREAFAWHIKTTRFKPAEFVAEELRGLEADWAVSGGWALDLFLGVPNRYHHDLDVSVWREDMPALQKHLLERGWRVHKIVDKGKYAVWEQGEALEPSVVQVHARRGEHEFLDFVISPREGGDWVYRRMEEIRLPMGKATLRSQGIPHLAPEIVLLFKSGRGGKDSRGKDEGDFERTLPRLPEERRTWLREALRRWKPEHPWPGRL